MAPKYNKKTLYLHTYKVYLTLQCSIINNILLNLHMVDNYLHTGPIMLFIAKLHKII